MKKILFTIVALMLSMMMTAGNFVMISYSGRAELERLFDDPNLTVHFYTDSEVYATAGHFDASTMVLLDKNAFSENETYSLVYCPLSNQNSYLEENQIDAIIQLKDYFIAKGSAKPFKNDGAVAIFNKEARLPQLTRDFPTVTEEDPRIREMMNQVNMDSLEATVQHLQDLNSRIWNSTNAFTASDWIAGRMEALGLEVEQQAFYANTWLGSGQAAPNVIGIQRGTLYPDTYVVCGSHFDSFSWESMYGSGNAPGADDNATGVASVLESARILTQYEFEYSIVYCAYGCEEMGLYGSEAYASRCQQQGMDIIGYFNNDMNGYLYGDQIHIDCIYPNSVAPIGNYYINVGNVYFPEMQVRHVNFNEGDSDHTSFNNHGYMGIYPFEDYQNYSPYIHTPNDLIGNSVNSWAMSQRYCQMNIGCLAEIANPIGETPVVECNPPLDFQFLFPIDRELSYLYLYWSVPEEGSTGELLHFDVYRDNSVIATLEYEAPNIHYEYWDTITIGEQAEYFIMAVYSDGCEASSDTLIGEGQWYSVNEMDVDQALIYPNPVEGELTIQAEGLQRVVIYNAMGQQVASVETKESECTLSMEAYPKGLYTIRLITRDGVVARSVVLK
ncbi:MAG: M28 family peptidase [Bacteroidales bacterium]|nr:M28 family peptidase [Bacteroidales bacterium]